MIQPLPAAATPAELALAVEANAAGRLRLLAGAEGVELHEDSDRLWTRSPLPHPMLNHVSLPRFPADAVDERIDAALAPYRAIGQRSYWWLGPSARPRDLGGRLIAHGLEHGASIAGLALPLRRLPLGRPVPPGLVVERVAEDDALRRWLPLFMSERDTPQIGAFFLRYYQHIGYAPDAPLHNYLATLDGQPVACATLILAAGVAGIGGVAVAEGARRQGIGAAITLAPLAYGRELGYHWAALQSAHAGPNLYRALGFREYCRIEAYNG